MEELELLQGTVAADTVQQFCHAGAKSPLIPQETQRHLAVQLLFGHNPTSFKRYSYLKITIVLKLIIHENLLAGHTFFVIIYLSLLIML